MRRISTPTAAQDLFGPGKHGFRNGDPANAILATRLQAEWFNALQEEVATAVEQSGAALNPANSGQLSEAIDGVVDRKAPVATKAEAEESVEANANNTKRMTPLRVLQAIKKNMVAATEAVVGMLRVGTQAEVNAGALDNVAVTPKKLRWGVSYLIAANGYLALPVWLGGLVIQWATVQVYSNGTNGGSATVTLPMAFPATFFGILAIKKAAAYVNGVDGVYATTASASTATIQIDAASGNEGAGNRDIFYIALGN